MPHALKSLGFVVAAVAALGAIGGPSEAASSTNVRATAQQRPQPEPLGSRSLPCDFEANRGQTAPEVDFVARCAGYAAFLTKGDAVIRTGGEAFRVHFVGGRETAAVASEVRPGCSNYLIGNDEQRWTTDVPRFGRVAYDDVLPGVDVSWRTRGREIAFDLTVAPGADPAAVRVKLDGADWAGRDADGNLSIGLPSGGRARLSAPRAWQETGGVRRDVAVSFAPGGARDEVAFEVGAFDRTRALVIDPSLTVSTYLGGGADETPFGMATDSIGSIYITGQSRSTDYPTKTGSFQTAKGDSSTSIGDGFVTKFDPTGRTLVYSTYLGGNAEDIPLCVAVDSSGNAIVGGLTSSTNFPLQGAYQTSPGNGFLAKLNSGGTGLAWSTYYPDQATHVGLDSSGNVCFFSASSGHAFVFDSTATSLVYAVAIGAFNPPQFIWSSMAVDPSSGAMWLGGRITQSNLAISGAFSTTYAGGSNDGWLVRLNTAGDEVYRSYIGGSGDEYIRALAVDASGNVLVVGDTTSTNFPLAGAHQTTYGGATDGFVMKLNSSGSTLSFSTYLGGTGLDTPNFVIGGPNGEVFAGGYTNSTDFPTRDAVQSANAGGLDVTLAEFTSTGSLTRSTYLGGAGSDSPMGIAVSALGRPLVTGSTRSADFPTACAYQTALGGSSDAFLAGIATSSVTYGDLSAATLQGATVGRNSAHALTIGGGTAPLAWTLQRGPLPAGMSLSSAGVLSGTPTTPGSASFFARVDDANAACAVREYRITVNPVPAVPTTTLPAWTVNQPYARAVPQTGGTAPFSWGLVSGTLPAGLSVTTTGSLTGTPTAAGDHTFVLSVTDANGATASGTVSLRINAAPAITTSALPGWTQGRPFAQSIGTSGGTAPLAWSIASGTLPIDAGIDAATGALTGTALAAGSYTFTVRIADATGASAERELTVVVNIPPRTSSPRMPIGVVGRPYSVGFAFEGGTPPLVWTIASGQLPEGFLGVGLGEGLLQGTPTKPARAAFTLNLTDAAGAVAGGPYEIVVAPLADLSAGRRREPFTILAEESGEDVVRCVELLAGSVLDFGVKLRGGTLFAVDLALLDSAEQPFDLTAFRTVKSKSISVKGVPIPRTGRWFVVVRPRSGFEGALTLDIAARAPTRSDGTATLDPAGAAVTIPFSALPGSKVVVTAKSAKGSLALPTITSLVDAAGTELLVSADLKTAKKGATLKPKTPLAGGDYVVTLAANGGAAGDVEWIVSVRSPKGYRFAQPDVAVTGQ